VKLLQSSPEALVFNLAEGEHRSLRRILNLYPVVPAAYQPLSRAPQETRSGEEQRLLDEALAEQRNSLRQQVRTWLHTANRFRPVRTGFNFTLLRTDAGWLLQVLNDIRVGHWLLLGAPDELPDADEVRTLHPVLHRAWLVMELSGTFQLEILQALESDPKG
jgi:hypothetical protein